MNTLFNTFLAIHVLGGTVGLVSGTLNMTARKGGPRHKRVGRVFAVSMLATGLSALVLSVMHPSPFLFIVGVFTIYMVGTGWRYLRRMRAPQAGTAWIDRGLTLAMAATAVVFVVMGVTRLAHMNLFGLVFVAFGTIALMFVRRDLRYQRHGVGRAGEWISAHLQRMMGAYIAALTAFLVVNAHHLPGQLPAVVYWLLPTAIITPLIVRWAARHETRKA